MITSTQILRLSEEYFNSFNINGYLLKVFVNPNSDDLRELKSKRIRFIADNKIKKVYVWNGYNAIHNSVVPKLGYPEQVGFNLFCGEAVVGSSISYLSDADFIDYIVIKFEKLNLNQKEIDIVKFNLAQNWTWLDKYIDGCSDYMNKMKIKLDKKMNRKNKSL